MTDLADFLRVRYTERRALAETAARLQADPENGWGILDTSTYAQSERRRWISPHIGMIHDPEAAEHIVANNPAAVLADLDAKLAIIDEVFRYEATIDGEWGCSHSAEAIAAGLCPERAPSDIRTLRLLAKPFAGHPDYKAKWAT